MRSAGLLPYREVGHTEVLIAHPGGPFWASKDAGAWSMVKGVVEPHESALETALREFSEETGWPTPPEPWIELGEVRLRSGKRILGWAVEADFDPGTLAPGEFTITLGGKEATFPEIDRVGWFDLATAAEKLNPAYRSFLDRLERHVAGNG